MIKRIALLVMIFVLSLSASALAAESGSGIIEGQIVNGTAGGGSVANQNVTLTTYVNDAETGKAAGKTDTEGRFVFDGLLTQPDYSYQVLITFQEAEYTGELLSFAEGEVTKPVEMIVYDSTTSDDGVKVETAHTIIRVGQGSFEITEFYLFANGTDRTYIGSGEITATGKRRTLRLPLPAKITELQYGGELMECCVVPGEEGFFDTMPVMPGSREVVYSYKVDYKAASYTFSQEINYPVADYHLLIQGENIGITADQLTTEEPIVIEGVQYNHLSGWDFLPGDILSVQLSGLPRSGSQGVITWVAVTLIVLAIASVFGYQLRRKRLQPVRPVDKLEQGRQRLIAELAQLDDDFEDGKIAEADYTKIRAVKKAQLAQLMPKSKPTPRSK